MVSYLIKRFAKVLESGTKSRGPVPSQYELLPITTFSMDVLGILKTTVSFNSAVTKMR